MSAPDVPGLIDSIRGPQDLKGLSADELAVLAAQIRDFLVAKVSRTGGHLGPNLGVVELPLALHRVFDSPKDRILFDTGHQGYVHKIVTGRQDGFDLLRQRGGLTGYDPATAQRLRKVHTARCSSRVEAPRFPPGNCRGSTRAGTIAAWMTFGWAWSCQPGQPGGASRPIPAA